MSSRPRSKKPAPSEADQRKIEAEERMKNWFALVMGVLFIYEWQVECHQPPTWQELKRECGQRAYLVIGRIASSKRDDEALVWGTRTRTPPHRRLTVNLTFRGRQFARDLMECQPFTAPFVNPREAVLSLVRARRS